MERDFSDDKDELPRLTLIEHLEELRRRIFYSIFGVIFAFIFTSFYSKEIFRVFALPLKKYLPSNTNLVFTKIQEPFTLYLKVSFFSAIILASPFILFQVWKFISPGLYKREKRLLVPFLFFSFFLFISGILFAYFVLFPDACSFLLGIGRDFKPMITISEYFNLAMFVILGTGVIFQMPLFIIILTYFGIISPSFLVKKMRYAIFLIFVIAAVFSPTVDVVNLFIFALPMVVLYILSVLLSYFFYRKGDNEGD